MHDVTEKEPQNEKVDLSPQVIGEGKKHRIIDMVCDQASGRLYTLNSGWVLEIWSLDQDRTKPQGRLTVCANEGGKDFIGLYY